MPPPFNLFRTRNSCLAAIGSGAHISQLEKIYRQCSKAQLIAIAKLQKQQLLMPIEDQKKVRQQLTTLFKELNQNNPVDAPDVNCIECELTLASDTAQFRHYQNSKATEDDPVVVFFHGGSFVFSDFNMSHWFLIKLAQATGLSIVAATFPVAPEVVFPEFQKDALKSWKIIQANRDKLNISNGTLLSGYEVGCQLATFLANTPVEQTVPARGCILFSPLFDYSPDSPSMLDNFGCFPYHEEYVEWIFSTAILHGDTSIQAVAAYSARRYEVQSCWPPTLLLTAEHDPLASDAVYLGRKLEGAGVDVKHDELENAFLGYASLPGMDFLDAAISQASDSICRFLEETVNPRSNATLSMPSTDIGNNEKPEEHQSQEPQFVQQPDQTGEDQTVELTLEQSTSNEAYEAEVAPDRPSQIPESDPLEENIEPEDSSHASVQEFNELVEDIIGAASKEISEEEDEKQDEPPIQPRQPSTISGIRPPKIDILPNAREKESAVETAKLSVASPNESALPNESVRPEESVLLEETMDESMTILPISTHESAVTQTRAMPSLSKSKKLRYTRKNLKL